MIREHKSKLFLITSLISSYILVSLILDLLRLDAYIAPIIFLCIHIAIALSVLKLDVFYSPVKVNIYKQLLVNLGVSIAIASYYLLFEQYRSALVVGITFGICYINGFVLTLIIKAPSRSKAYRRAFIYYIAYIGGLIGLSFAYKMNNKEFFISFMYLDVTLILGCIYFTLMKTYYEEPSDKKKIKRSKILYNKDGSRKNTRRAQLSTSIVISKPILSYVFNLAFFLCIIHLLETTYFTNEVAKYINLGYLKLTSFVYLLFIAVNSFRYNDLRNEELKKSLKIANVVAIYVIIGIIIYPIIGFASTMSGELLKPLMTMASLVGIYGYFRYVSIVNFENKFKLLYLLGFIFALFVGANITRIFTNIIPDAYKAINVVYINILLAIMFATLVVALYLRKYVQDKPKHKLYEPRSVMQIFIVTLALTSLMNFVIINLSTTIINSIYVLVASDKGAVTFSLLMHTIVPGLLASLIFLNINSRSRRLNYFLLAARIIGLTLFAYKVIESLDLIARANYEYIGYVTCLYLSLILASRVSERFTRFSQLVITSFVVLILIEFIFYILDIFEITPSGLSLLQYRLTFALYFTALIFAYMYLRNMKLSKDNRVFSFYRLITIGFSTLILFVTFISSAGASNLKSNWVKDKLIDFILNSSWVEYIDPSILERLKNHINWDSLPEGFDINDYLKYLTTYFTVDKETSDIAFYKESTGFTYTVNTNGVDQGWSYNTSSKVISTYNSNPYNVSTDLFNKLDSYFKEQGVEEWYSKDSTVLKIVTERLMTDKLLPISQLSSSFSLANETNLSKLYGDSLLTDSTKVGSISMDSVSIKFTDYNTLKAIYELYQNSHSYDYEDINQFTAIPTSIYNSVLGINSHMTNTYNLNRAEKNDFVKLFAIADYIYEMYTVDIPVFWTKKQDLDGFMTSKSGTLADAVSLFTMIARANNIPVRTTLGYYTLGNTMEVKKELRMPSIEINLPGYGWVDGTYFALKMVNSNSNNIAGLDVEEMQLPILGAQYDYETVIRNNVYTGFDGTSFTAGTCYDSNAHTLVNYKSLGFDSFNNRVVIANYQLYKDNVSLPLNTFMYQSVDYSGNKNEACKTGSSTGSYMVTSGLNAFYGGQSQEIEWSNTSRRKMISLFDSYKQTSTDNLISFPYEIRNAISAHINTYSSVYSQDSNIYRKLYKIKDSITTEFEVVSGKDSTSLLDVINNKQGTINDLNKILFVIARELGITARLYSGYRLQGETVSMANFEYGIELYTPTSNNSGVWVSLPDDFRNFETLIDDLKVEVLEPSVNVSGSSFNYVDTKELYETEYRNMCTEYFRITDPLVGIVDIKASDIMMVSKPVGSTVSVDKDTCRYIFDRAGNYSFYYSVTSDITYASKAFYLTVTVIPASPKLYWNGNYNYERNIVSRDSGLDKIFVINGKEVNLCGSTSNSLIVAEDIFSTIRKGDGRYNSNNASFINPTKDNVNTGSGYGATCSIKFTNNQTINYSFTYTDSTGKIQRSSSLAIGVEVYADTPIIENTSNMFVYETNYANIFDHIRSIKYLNGVNVPSSEIKLYIGGVEVFNFYDSYRFMQDIGDKQYLDLPMEFVISGVRQNPIYVRIERATPNNVSYYNNYRSVINGAYFDQGITNNINSIFSVNNVIKGENVEIRYEFDFYINGIKQNESRIVGNDIYSYKIYKEGISGQTPAYFIVYAIETTTGRERSTQFTYNIIIETASIIFNGVYDLTIVHGQSNSTNLINSISARDVLNESYTIKCDVINTTTGYIQTVDCTNFKTINYKNLGFTKFTDEYQIRYYTTDKTGTINEAYAKINIIEPKPSLDINQNVYNLYIGYNINFCDYITRAESYFGTNVKTIVKWKYNNASYYCYNGKTLKFTDSDNEKIISVEYSITYNDSTTTVVQSYRIVYNTTPPVPDFSTISTLSMYSEENVVVGEKALEQKSNIDLCKFIKATDNGNGTIIYPTKFYLYQGKELNEDMLLTNSTCGTRYYRFNSHGEYTVSYTFKDTVGNTTVANVMLSVFPYINTLNSLNDVDNLEDNAYFNLHIQYIGSADGKMHFVDTKGNNTYITNNHLAISNVENLSIGDSIKATYRYSKQDNQIYLVNTYNLFNDSDYAFSVDYEIDKETVFKGLSERCITNTLKDEYVFTLGTTINANFDTYKKDGVMYIKDQCGSVEVEKLTSTYSFIEDVQKNKNYRFTAFTSLEGSVQLGETYIGKLPSVWLSAKYIRTYILIIVIAVGVYFITKEVVKAIKANKERLKYEDELSKLPEVERQRLQLHYSKMIEKRYNNILLALRKYYNATKISRSETHNEYARRLIKGNVIDLNELMFITDIYNRCRYSKDTINKSHYLYVEKYYKEMFENFEHIIGDDKLKSIILKLRKY